MDPIQRDMELLSSSMATYAYIQANPESFALYFMMGVCFGLLLALCLLVSGIACTPRQRPKAKAPTSSPERRQLKLSSEEEEDESTGEEDGEDSGIPKVTVVPCMMSERSSPSTNGTLKSLNVFASAEELERARRLEERERIVREIWRNGQPDILVTGTGTIGRVHYH